MGPTTDSVVSSVDDTNDFVMTPSPMTEVGSYDELDAALVFCVPRLPFKSAESYIMLSYGESAKEGHVRYTDGSGLYVAPGSDDISGIFGGSLNNSVMYNGVTVYFYTCGDHSYAIWSYGGYSYCYHAAEDDVYSTVHRIVETTAECNSAK